MAEVIKALQEKYLERDNDGKIVAFRGENLDLNETYFYFIWITHL